MPIKLNGTFWQLNEIVAATGSPESKVYRAFAGAETTVKIGQTFLVPEEAAIKFINKCGTNPIKTIALSSAATLSRIYARNFTRLIAMGIPTENGRIRKDYYEILDRHIQAQRKDPSDNLSRRAIERAGKAALAEINALKEQENQDVSTDSTVND